MEAVISRESENEDIETLDARVFDHPVDVSPTFPADFSPSTNSSQTSSTECSTWDPASEKECLVQQGWEPTNTKNPDPVPDKYAKTYELEKFKENRMIIFDHDHFRNGLLRPGTEKDEEKLRETFKKFRFKIDHYENLKKIELLDKIKEFASSDFTGCGCICVAILTHGNKKKPGFLKAYDKEYSEYDIFKHFDASKYPKLGAKPIIFIIQACRGAEPAPKAGTGGKKPFQFDHGGEGESYNLPTEADRIVFHSSYVGRASLRHPVDGSWFIQTLCEEINKHALTHDLETIFRLVRRRVALDCDTDEGWKQMPVVTTTTLRELYLAPNLQQEDDQSRPASAQGFVYQTNDPDVYPLSNQIAERLKEHMCLKEIHNTISDPDASPTLMQLHHLPCGCFVEYFDYLKNCLESFSRHNKDDEVAKSILKMMRKTGSGSECNLQKFSYIEDAWEHLEANKDRFPPYGFKFVHRMYIPLKRLEAVPKTRSLEGLPHEGDDLNKCGWLYVTLVFFTTMGVLRLTKIFK